MKRNYYLVLVALLALPIMRCQKEAPVAPPVDERKVTPAPQPAISAAEVEELQKKVATLSAQEAELAAVKAKVVSLEEELGYVKSGLNHLEKKPIPAPVETDESPEAKPATETESAPEPAVEKPVEVVEPVPTGMPPEPEDITTQPADEEPDVSEGEDLAGTPVGNVELVNLKFATQLDREKRTVIDEKSTFSMLDNRLYCWLVLSNLADDETRIRLFWKHEGKVISDIELRVGKRTSHWRTWAYIKPNLVGQWEVELQDLAGRVVGTGSFTVE